MHRTSVLLREDTPSMRVKVMPNCLVRAFDDHAPSVPRYFTAGEIIPCLDAIEAAQLIKDEVVTEAVDAS